MEALIFISGIIAIIVCAMVCDKKGRTVWKGVLAGFLLGWIGVIFCVFFLDDHSDNNKN